MLFFPITHILNTQPKTIERINLVIQAMKDEISIIKAKNIELKQKVDDLEQNCRMDNLNFYGIQEDVGEDLRKVTDNIMIHKLEAENIKIKNLDGHRNLDCCA